MVLLRHPPVPFLRTFIRQHEGREASHVSRLVQSYSSDGCSVLSVLSPFSSTMYAETQAVLTVARGGWIFFLYYLTKQSRPVVITSISVCSFISAIRKKLPVFVSPSPRLPIDKLAQSCIWLSPVWHLVHQQATPPLPAANLVLVPRVIFLWLWQDDSTFSSCCYDVKRKLWIQMK